MICDNCKKRFKAGNAPDGTPNGVGFQMQNGKIITVCRSCIMLVGMMSDSKKDEFFKKLGVDIDGK